MFIVDLPDSVHAGVQSITEGSTSAVYSGNGTDLAELDGTYYSYQGFNQYMYKDNKIWARSYFIIFPPAGAFSDNTYLTQGWVSSDYTREIWKQSKTIQGWLTGSTCLNSSTFIQNGTGNALYGCYRSSYGEWENVVPGKSPNQVSGYVSYGNNGYEAHVGATEPQGTRYISRTRFGTTNLISSSDTAVDGTAINAIDPVVSYKYIVSTSASTPSKNSVISSGTTVNSDTFNINDKITDKSSQYYVYVLAKSYTGLYSERVQQLVVPRYTLTVDAGTNISSVSGGGTYNAGKTINISATAKDNYTFSYWSGADVSFASSSSASTTITMLAANTTITAYGKGKSYNLTIDPAGGNIQTKAALGSTGFIWEGITTQPVIQTFVYGNKVNISLEDDEEGIAAYGLRGQPTKEHYIFNGWKITSGGGSVYTSSSSGSYGKSAYAFDGNYAGDVTITAQWKPNKYRQIVYVRYENADGTFTDYSKVMDTDCDYNSTCSWSRPSDATYQKAGISYTVEDESTKYITVYRNIFRQIVYVRYQNENGEWGDYNKVIDSDYRYNSTCSWSRTADGTYQAANISYTVTKANTKYVNVYRKVYTITVKHQVYNEDTGKYEVEDTTTAKHYAGEKCTPKNHTKDITGYHYEKSDAAYTVSGDTTKNVYYRGNNYKITFTDSYHQTITYDCIYSKTYTVPTPDNVTFAVVFDYANNSFENITEYTSNSFKGWKNPNGNIVYYSGDTFRNISTGDALMYTAVYNPAEAVELKELKETNIEVPTGWYTKPQSETNSLTRITSAIVPDENVRVYAYWNKRPVFDLGTKDDYYRRLYNKMTITEPMLLYNVSNTDEEDKYVRHINITSVEFMSKDGNVTKVENPTEPVYLENYTAYRVSYSITDYGTTIGTTDKIPATSTSITDWYAIEDDTSPVLYTTDKYIYTSNENVTEKNILNLLTGVQKADDAEDSHNVSYWLNQMDSLDITVKCIYYKGIMYENDIAKELIKIKNEGITTEVMVTYETTDSLGNISFAHAYVYFLNAANDTDLSANNTRISVRFIDKESLYTLNPNSSWAVNPKLYDILVETLNKTSSDKVTSSSVYTTKDGDKVLVRRYY